MQISKGNKNFAFSSFYKCFAFLFMICPLIFMVSCKDDLKDAYCRNTKTDPEMLKNPLEAYNKDSIDITIADYYYYQEHKQNELYDLLKDYSGNNVGMKVLQAKLFIYKDEYQKAIEKLDGVLADYPKHLEALFLKEKAQEILNLKGKISTGSDVLNNVIQTSIIFRELRFPDKSLDILMNYLDSDDNNYWYEIAKSIRLYAIYIGDNLDTRYDLIKNEIYKKYDLLVPDILEVSVTYNEKFGCLILFDKIITFLVLDENFLKQELTPEEIDQIEKDNHYWEYKKGLEDSGENTPEEINYLLSFPFEMYVAYRYINQLNIQMDEYKARKYISSLYVARMDLGQDFYDILSESKSSKNELYALIIDNEITSKFYKLNFTNLFYGFQKNSLNKKNWNGPYIGYPESDAYGWDFVYYENLDSKNVRIISGGFDFKVDNFDKLEGDDVDFSMSY
jgi:hypothetical protein